MEVDIALGAESRFELKAQSSSTPAVTWPMVPSPPGTKHVPLPTEPRTSARPRPSPPISCANFREDSGPQPSPRSCPITSWSELRTC
jgi:hypothetical protein